MNETFSVKRMPGSRTIRDLVITSGRVISKTPPDFSTFAQIEEELMESDVMDAEGSLHQKTNEVCIMEDAESIDLAWFENTNLNRVKNGTRCLLQLGVRDWESLGTSRQEFKKRVW